MKIIRLLVVMLFAWLPFHSSSQYMLNGGFEDYIATPPALPATPNNYSINYAEHWHLLNASPDLFHPSTITNPVGGSVYLPHSGNGHANFVWSASSSGVGEYFYGETLPLTAGETYQVTFYVQKTGGSEDLSMGLYISSSVPEPMPDPYSPTVVPQIRVFPDNFNYTKATFCYTALQSGPHYLTFGFFSSQPQVPPVQMVVLDDVSVDALAPGNASNAVLSIPSSTFCEGTNITVDGSASTDETDYEWDIFKIVNGNEQQVYNGSAQSGQAGTLNVSSVLASAGQAIQGGDCYRVYLKTYFNCPDVAFVDFCVEDPEIDFLSNSALCQNAPVELEVTGEDGWTYSWSQGAVPLANGTGLKTLTVTPASTGTVTYTVTVTTPTGCSATESHSFIVHSANNQPPSMNGINGSGEYTLYANTESLVNFISQLFNDDPLEIVNSSLSESNSSNDYDLSFPSAGTGQLAFSWNLGFGGWIAGPVVEPGNYQFTITSIDNNACGSDTAHFTFRIVVICKNCPVCISYNNRTPSNNPLPGETKAARCINVALNDQVIVGQGNHVLFQAGESVSINPDNFDTDGGTFEALIDPGTCVNDCESCCDDWTGFTYDPFIETDIDGNLTNVVYVGRDDEDPTNDFFQVTDTDHPFCAYGITGYELLIYDEYQSGTIFYDHVNISGVCCSYVSPSLENPVTHSSIWWDGQKPNGEMAPDGVYYFKLKLYGCGGQEEIIEGIIGIDVPVSGMILNQGGQIYSASNTFTAPVTTQEKQAFEALASGIELYPNPARESMRITGVDTIDTISVQIFDEKGNVLTKKEDVHQRQFNVSRLIAGTYHCRIYIGNQYLVKKFVKL